MRQKRTPLVSGAMPPRRALLVAAAHINLPATIGAVEEDLQSHGLYDYQMLTSVVRLSPANALVTSGDSYELCEAG